MFIYCLICEGCLMLGQMFPINRYKLICDIYVESFHPSKLYNHNHKSTTAQTTNLPVTELSAFIIGVPASGKCSLSWTYIMYLKHGILYYFFNQFHKSLLITFKAPHLHGYNHHSQSLVSGLIANPCPSLIDLVQ